MRVPILNSNSSAKGKIVLIFLITLKTTTTKSLGETPQVVRNCVKRFQRKGQTSVNHSNNVKNNNYKGYVKHSEWLQTVLRFPAPRAN